MSLPLRRCNHHSQGKLADFYKSGKDQDGIEWGDFSRERESDLTWQDALITQKQWLGKEKK